MSIDFTNINLEIIDININATPDIFINQNGVTFSKRVLEDLNYPSNVQYGIDADKRIFAIRVCKSKDPKAVPFSKTKTEQTTTLSCGNKNLHDVLAALIPNYEKNNRYKISGEFDSENKIMYYDMTTAELSMFRAPKE